MECDCSKSFAFVLNLYALFCFNCLVQALVKASAVHKTTCKFINNDNFAVFNNIVNIEFHNTVSLDSLVYMVLNCKVFRVCKVFNAEKFFGFLNTVLCKCSCFLLFVYNIVDVVFCVVILHIFFGVKLFKALNL